MCQPQVHRRGQKLPVTIYYMIAKGTEEEMRWQSYARKLDDAETIHDGASSGAWSTVESVLEESEKTSCFQSENSESKLTRRPCPK